MISTDPTEPTAMLYQAIQDLERAKEVVATMQAHGQAYLKRISELEQARTHDLLRIAEQETTISRQAKRLEILEEDQRQTACAWKLAQDQIRYLEQRVVDAQIRHYGA